MLECETLKYELWSIEKPEDPTFSPAVRLLWDAFGPQGEIEDEDSIRQFVLDDIFTPTPEGTYLSRLKRLFRYSVYRRYYPSDPHTKPYLQSSIAEAARSNSRYVDDRISEIVLELEARLPHVHADRDTFPGRDSLE
jgi:hypothetical protein